MSKGMKRHDFEQVYSKLYSMFSCRINVMRLVAARLYWAVFTPLEFTVGLFANNF